MRTFALSLTDPTYGDLGPRRDRARALRESRGLFAEPFYGIHARRLGIMTSRVYTLDGPGGDPMNPKTVGTWLSHRALWAACLLTQGDDEFFLLEDDAVFPEDWTAKFDAARWDLPSDWDFVNFGACCAEDKEKEHIAGPIYKVDGGPMCLHAYLVKRRALMTLIETQDEVGCYAPIDISVLVHTLPKLAAYTVLPRVAEQLDFDELLP